MAENVRIARIINKLCISTISFGIIIVSLLIFSINWISVETEAKIVFYMLSLFVINQLFIKPFSKVS